MFEDKATSARGPGARRLLLPGVLILLAIAAIGIGWRAKSRASLADWTDAQTRLTVSVIHAAPARSGGTLTLPATLDALQTAPVYGRANGYVRRWFVDIGDRVSRGQVLAVIDAPELEAQVVAARANLQTALANQHLAETTAARWRSMLAQDAVSRQDADEKAGDLAAKRAATSAARAMLAQLAAQQAYTTLRAPFAGVVTTRSANVGTLVTVGNATAAPLFTVADNSAIRIYVRVPQAVVAQVHPGMMVAVAVPEYPGRGFAARLTRSANAVDAASGTVLVQLLAANADHALLPGGFARASFPGAARAGQLELPATALIVGEKGTTVAVVDGNNRVALRPLAIAQDLGDTVRIAGGVSPADRIIDNPPDSLQAGDSVSIAGTGSGAAGGK